MPELSELHPALTAFPTALIMCAFFLEIAGALTAKRTLREAARINLGLGAVFAAAAFLSGYPASEAANQTFQVADEVIGRHHLLGKLLLFALFPAAVLRWLLEEIPENAKKAVSSVYWVLLTLSTGLVIATGYQGGRLVFDHGAGVKAAIRP